MKSYPTTLGRLDERAHGIGIGLVGRRCVLRHVARHGVLSIRVATLSRRRRSDARAGDADRGHRVIDLVTRGSHHHRVPGEQRPPAHRHFAATMRKACSTRADSEVLAQGGRVRCCPGSNKHSLAPQPECRARAIKFEPSWQGRGRRRCMAHCRAVRGCVYAVLAWYTGASSSVHTTHTSVLSARLG